MSRDLDELVRRIEHAEPVHPFKTLVANHFYVDDLISTEGGLWLLMLDALLLVPILFAAFFYPLQALIVALVVIVMPLTAYQGYTVWRRRHPRPPT